MDMPKSGFPTRERTAARNCAVAGVIVIAIAGAAAPFYVRAPLAPWIAAVLLAIAAAIAIALLWLRRGREEAVGAQRTVGATGISLRQERSRCGRTPDCVSQSGWDGGRTVLTPRLPAKR